MNGEPLDGVEHLDGDTAAVLEVLGEVHGGHPALPQFALEVVAVGEGRREVLHGIRHGRSSSATKMSLSGEPSVR